jgi:hypothetical protein
MDTSTVNYKQSVKIIPSEDWVIIQDYKIEKYRYGLKGFIRFNTERDKTVHTIASIHLDHNKRFKFLFTWE